MQISASRANSKHYRSPSPPTPDPVSEIIDIYFTVNIIIYSMELCRQYLHVHSSQVRTKGQVIVDR